METFNSHSREETADFSAKWLKDISKKHVNRKRAVFVGLSGHLGSGKTTFVQAIARNLGIKEKVTSPTFVLMKIYETVSDSWKKLIHIDAYRLEEKGELSILKLAELIADKGNLIMLEWPENVDLEKELDEKIFFEIKDGVHLIKSEPARV